MRKIIGILLLLCGTVEIQAQSFTGQAPLAPVGSDAFYRIAISPQLSQHLNAEFTNIRIIDKDNREVPYLLETESPAYYTTQFREYEIIEKKQQKKCCTTLVLRNPDSSPINNIILSIRNADVTKQATVLGSDDRENWFALKQRFTINSVDNKTETSEIRIVDFPLSNYSYYQVQIEDSTSSPLNILRAGYYEVISEDGKYSEITARISKSDSISQKKSYINIVFDAPQVVDKLQIAMTGAPYFLRKAALYNDTERLNRKRKKVRHLDPLYTIELSSKQSSAIEMPGIKLEKLLIVIENNDNQPLELSSLSVFQLNRYLTAWLKKDEKYSIKLGNEQLQAPVYDLEFFKDNIPAQPQVLSIGALAMDESDDEPSSPTFFTSSAFIWAAIVLVMVILGFMALKMVNENKFRQE